MDEHIGDVGGDSQVWNEAVTSSKSTFTTQAHSKYNVKPFVTVGIITFYVVAFCGYHYYVLYE